ncbi:MAG: LLM class flavin-dependent oxidoreductase [Gammaproteobacteria bacterium]|nr:LLM class flavin-dependent oxidoreductase [Gammaproteobacteria bacterium]
MVPLGILQFTDGVDGKTLLESTRRIEQLGYDILWIPEVFGREPVATCGYLLATTQRLRIGAGILNIYARDAHAAAQARNTLAELSGGRFVLGLGVSHPVLVEPRGHIFGSPAPSMKKYLSAVRTIQVDGVAAPTPAPIVIAGHGPKLMQVAAAHADGLFLYLQPPEQVAAARELLGPTKQIHVVVRTVLCGDRAKARAAARAALGFYMQLPAYHRAWQTAGFTAADYANGGSDRLIDTLAPSGSVNTLQEVFARYEQAGASHISLYPIHPEDEHTSDRAGGYLWDWASFEALAPSRR